MRSKHYALVLYAYSNERSTRFVQHQPHCGQG